MSLPRELSGGVISKTSNNGRKDYVFITVAVVIIVNILLIGRTGEGKKCYLSTAQTGILGK